MILRNWMVPFVLVAACTVERTTVPVAPTWVEVAPILNAKCASCHSGANAAAGWRVGSYVDAIACVSPENTAATLPASAGAPIVSALDRAPHVGLLSDAERDTLTAWVSTGAPAFTVDAHTPDIIDPRSPNFHATTLRAARWKPMLDSTDPNACGRCHDGTLSRPSSVTFGAPDAPSCTSCHDQPGGVLACGTCHGTDKHAYPPRDTCFFPNDPSGGAHAVHVESTPLHTTGLACKTCHPVPGTPVMGGTHGDGTLEIAFDTTRVTPEASWNPATKACAVTCHDQGGARPQPTWTDSKPMGCNDCHSSPPANHYQGACNACHAEANATGTALTGGLLHMNGKVDLGDGSGKCGACHGDGDSPWPKDKTHSAHANPDIASPVACETCHVVPTDIHSPGHLGAPVAIRFSGHAYDRGASPSWNGTSCQNVACHGANLADVPLVPVWNDTSGKAAACGACHGIPPTQHTTALDCNRSSCHGAEVTSPPNLTITPSGKSLHINGVIDLQ